MDEQPGFIEKLARNGQLCLLAVSVAILALGLALIFLAARLA